MSDINIGLLGLGNVGGGVWEIIHKNRAKIEKYLGSRIKIKRVLVKDPEKNRSVDVPGEVLTTDPQTIFEDPEIQIVVEVIGGMNPAFEYIKKALEHGKHVVTANKAVISKWGRELIELAGRRGVELRFEGSVGGGIPVIATLTQSLVANEIEEIVGIINGTTNYILTRMTKCGMDFEQALEEAKNNGYAEADPSSDIEGEDAAFKLSILTSIAFGVRIDPNDIPREGITRVSKNEIEYATRLGYTVKLLASARKVGNALELYVHPALVPNYHPLAAVSNEFNALFIRGNAVGELMLYGKGAGSLPTGSAVLGDVLDIAKRIQYNAKNGIMSKIPEAKLKIIGEGSGEYYIRLMVVDKPGVLGAIATKFGQYDISLASVAQWERGEPAVPVVFITHEVERVRLNKALEEIATFDFVNEVASILRVEKL